MMSYLELAQAYAKACRERDMALSQLADIGAGYAEKMDDFVRVVRCKDCAWYHIDLADLGAMHCILNMSWVKGNQFCSYGKRKG